MKIEKWECNIERGMEDCRPAEPWKDSPCVVCGRVIPATARGTHPTGLVTTTVDFETHDDIPKTINLKMFDDRLPDIEAKITRHTSMPGLNRCTAVFVQQPLVVEETKR